MKTAILVGATTGTTATDKTTVLRVIGAIATLNAILAVVVGSLVLAFNAAEVYAAPLLAIEATTFAFLFLFVWLHAKERPFPLAGLAVAAIASAVMINLVPLYWQGLGIHSIIHRSAIAGLFLLAVSVPGTCYSVFYALGATPRAFDSSRLPVMGFLTIAALIAYGLIVMYLIQNGAMQLNWSVFTMPFKFQSLNIETWQNGWPSFSLKDVKQPGMLNHIMGTLLLMGLTSLISLPIGVSVGIFVHEFAGPKLAGIISFSTTALRSISGIILAVTAMNLMNLTKPGTFWYELVHGQGYDVNGILQVKGSSFLFASIFISLLVIPLIAKATQEGLSSLPREISEGSIGLGASKEHTLFHIQLPWSLPNILTGLMLGCAEAAGALTIIFLISGTGEFGIGPSHTTTSLAYLIFDIKYGRELGDSVPELMSKYQYTAAIVLLVLTVGLTVAAMLMKKILSKRYKGE